MSFNRLFLLMYILLATLAVTQEGWCEEPDEYERGYRRPAVLGPAIVEGYDEVILQDHHPQEVNPMESKVVESDIIEDTYK